MDNNDQDPVNIRPAKPRPHRYQVSEDFWNPGKRKERSPGLLTLTGSVLLVGLALYFIFFGGLSQLGFLQADGLAASSKCSPAALPPNGTAKILDPAHVIQGSAMLSGLEIQNEHAYPIVTYLTNHMNGQAIMNLSVGSGQTAQISVPVGHYGIYFAIGNSWCNDSVGFENGYRINIRNGIDVQSGLITVLTPVTVEPGGPDSIHIGLTTRSPTEHGQNNVVETAGDRYLDLRQGAGGHYRTSGKINDVPLQFMVDTGASLTVIPPEVARQAGISDCKQQPFGTANGVVMGCIAKVDVLSFGNFAVHDIEVAVTQNLVGNALLGMNVLRQFEIHQQDDVMRISLR